MFVVNFLRLFQEKTPKSFFLAFFEFFSCILIFIIFFHQSGKFKDFLKFCQEIKKCQFFLLF